MPVYRAAELWNPATVTPAMNLTPLNELKFISDATRIQLQRELPQYATLCATTTTRIGPRDLLQFFCTHREVIPTWSAQSKNIASLTPSEAAAERGFDSLTLCSPRNTDEISGGLHVY